MMRRVLQYCVQLHCLIEADLGLWHPMKPALSLQLLLQLPIKGVLLRLAESGH